VLYHTFLGHPEGRRRAARHAQELPNLHLETSWCRSEEVLRLLDEVGPDRVLFGSDAATDGPAHFVRDPPNVEMVETYNQGLLALARRLPAGTLRALLEDNTRRLFGLPAPAAPEPVEDVEELFAAALAQAERVVAGVRRDRLGAPTPCADWDVRALLDHLRAVVRRARRAGGATPPDDVRAPWGLVPGPVARSGFVLELVAHASDLAVATGNRPQLDPRLADAAHRVAQRLVPASLRGGGGAFADPVPAPPGADAYGRLAAFLGRRPG
jgi:hypothetical protein